MRTLRVVIAAAVMVALAPLPARANHKIVIDADDTKGRLDIRKIESYGSEKPARVITTQLGWTPARIQDDGFFLVFFDTFGDEHFDYYVVASSTGKRMQGRLWRDYRNRKDRIVGGADVWRPDNTRRRLTVRVSFAQMKIDEGRTTYRWKVETLFTGDACPDVCFDMSPNNKAVQEPLPASLND